MPGVVADVRDPVDQLGVDPAGHRFVEPGRCPPRCPLADHLGHRVRVLHQPAVQLLDGEVDQPVLQVVMEGLGEQPTEQRRDRLLAEPWGEGVAHQRLDVVVAHLGEGDGRHLRHLVDDAPRVGRLGEPDSDPPRDAGRGDPVADDRLLEEVLAHELLEPPAEVVLALRDQGGVRDRQPERVLEESRHREPVRDRAHHRRLGAGVHEPEEPVAVPRHDVHHRGEQQEPHRDRAHPPQARAAERVSSGISCDEGCGDGHSRRFSRTA